MLIMVYLNIMNKVGILLFVILVYSCDKSSNVNTVKGVESKEFNQIGEEYLNNTTLEERIGQLIMVPVYSQTSFKDLETIISMVNPGGYIFFEDESYLIESKINFILDKTQSSLYPFIAIDGEPNLINNRLNTKVVDKKNNEFVSLYEVSETAEKITNELNKLNFNVNFSPVVDNGSNKSVIGDRAFAVEPDIISKYSIQYIKKHKEDNILAVPKHFPGHGFAYGDSHHELVQIDGSLPELIVFKKVLESADAVMIGHIAVVGGEYSTNHLPATISKVIIHDLLRVELEFEGLVITDALDMGAVSGIEYVELKSLAAGADILLMPNNGSNLIQEIKTKYYSDKDFETSINESINRIVATKIQYKLVNFTSSTNTGQLFSGEYTGYIGHYPVTMDLVVEEDTVFGNYTYLNNNTSLSLESNPNLTFSLYEFYKSDRVGLFEIFFCTKDRIYGMWKSTKTNAQLEFYLERVSNPI